VILRKTPTGPDIDDVAAIVVGVIATVRLIDPLILEVALIVAGRMPRRTTMLPLTVDVAATLPATLCVVLTAPLTVLVALI